MSSDLEHYGGDTRIVATRHEIQRVGDSIAAAQGSLAAALSFVNLLAHPMGYLRFGSELPALESRMQALRLSCQTAAESYFNFEVRLNHKLTMIEPVPVSWIASLAILLYSPLTMLKPDAFSARRISTGGFDSGASSLGVLSQRLVDLTKRTSATVRIEQYDNAQASPMLGAGGVGSGVSTGAQATAPQTTKTGRTFIVYIPGTEQWTPLAAQNPLDLDSNLQLISHPNFAASERATAAAMNQAGIGAGDRVVFVGHSQGGLIAANIASQHPKFEVAGMVTFGAPLQSVEISKHISVLSVEHQNDIVPFLDNGSNPLRANWLTVSRQDPMHWGDSVFHPHTIAAYHQTALEIDQSTDLGITKLRDRLLHLTGSHNVTVSEYQINRDGGMAIPLKIPNHLNLGNIKIGGIKLPPIDIPIG